MTIQDLVEDHSEDEVRELAEEIVYEIRSSHLADDETIDAETEHRCCKIVETMFEDEISDHKRRQKAKEQVT